MHIRMVSFFAASFALVLLTIVAETKPLSDVHENFEIEKDEHVAKSWTNLVALTGERVKREAMYDATEGRVKREETETEGTVKPSMSERWRSFKEKVTKMLKKIFKSGDGGTQGSIDAPKDMEEDATSDCGTGLMGRFIRWFWRAIGDQETRTQKRRGQGGSKGPPDQVPTGKEDAGKRNNGGGGGMGVDGGSGGSPDQDPTGKEDAEKKNTGEGEGNDGGSGKEGAVDTAPGKKDEGNATGGEGDAGEDRDEENVVGKDGAGEEGRGNETREGNDYSGKEKVEPPTQEVSDDWES